MAKQALILLAIATLIAAVVAAAGTACDEGRCTGDKPSESTCGGTAVCVTNDKEVCEWKLDCFCRCTQTNATSNCRRCDYSKKVDTAGAISYSCSWADCPVTEKCDPKLMGNFTGGCECVEFLTINVVSSYVWRCRGCDYAKKPTDGDCYCNGEEWVCRKPDPSNECGDKPPHESCKCSCFESEKGVLCQWSCPVFCPQTLIAVDCPCYLNARGDWNYECPTDPVPPPVDEPSCFQPSTHDVSKCKCICDTSVDGVRRCYYVCDPSICPKQEKVDDCKCIVYASGDVSATGISASAAVWLCPPEQPTPVPTTVPTPVPTPTDPEEPRFCTTTAPDPNCKCHCVTLTNADNSDKKVFCDWQCPCKDTCCGFPPARDCTCVKVERNGSVFFDWNCPPVSPCDETKRPARDCVCDVVRITDDGQRILGWICPKCEGKPPRDDCVCIPTREVPNAASDADRYTGWTWSCPVVCDGKPPADNCYCTLNSFSRTPTWVCPDKCKLEDKRDNCYCGRTPAGLVDWICPRVCNQTKEFPTDLPCSRAEAIAKCDPVTLTWIWTCPPRSCTCDGMPLPELNPDKHGCTTKEAKWTCKRIGDIVADVDAITAASIDGVIRPCARWVYECPTKPPREKCELQYVCGVLTCVDSNFGTPPIYCPAVDTSIYQCHNMCAKHYAVCAISSVSGTSECQMQYSVDYKMCLRKCQSQADPNDKCSYITDKCSCLATNGYCGWCSRRVSSAGTVIENGRCVRTTSNSTCLISRADNSFTTADALCPIVKDPNDEPTPTIGDDPTVADVDRCLSDARCFDPAKVNKRIIEKNVNFSVAVSTVVRSESDSGSFSVVIEVVGDAPSNDERDEICTAVRDAVFDELKISSSRRVGSVCKINPVASAKKRQATGSSEYIVDVQVAEAESGSASILALSGAALVVAILALF